MKVNSYQFHNANWHLMNENQTPEVSAPQLIFLFGSRDIIAKAEVYQTLKSSFPNANIVISSAAGAIFQEQLIDEELIANALEFEKTEIATAQICIQDYANSYEAGLALSEHFEKDGLKAMLVFSDGGLVNGSDLVKGLNVGFDEKVSITGGLASNFPDFEKTYIGLNQVPEEGNIIAIGFYGDDILIGCGTMGGWDGFGLERVVTRSEGNILYEIDGVPALNLYKEYLGEYAKELPQASFLFPLSVKLYADSEDTVVRTIVNVSEDDNAMIFAGDVPTNAKVRFMKSNFDKVIDGSQIAAQQALELFPEEKKADFALLVSCIGRRVVLANRTEEELEAVRDIVGEKTVLSGFYSNGEIAPIYGNTYCDLHNQTMTITVFAEK